MPRTEGTFKIPANIEPQASAPLDARQIVPTLADLTTAGTFSYPYEGMLVYVRSEHKFFVYKGGVVTSSASWQEVGSKNIFRSSSSLFTPYRATTWLPTLQNITYLDSNTSIVESDLIPYSSMVVDSEYVLAVYVGKQYNSGYFYGFLTLVAGVKYELDSNNRMLLRLPINVFIGDSILPSNNAINLGSDTQRFGSAFVGSVDCVQASFKGGSGGTQDNLKIAHDVGDGSWLSRSIGSQGGSTVAYKYVLPDKSGTIALESDVAPTNHASTNTTYGVGNGAKYGHLKLSDDFTGAGGGGGLDADSGVAATPKALIKAYRGIGDFFSIINSGDYFGMFRLSLTLDPSNRIETFAAESLLPHPLNITKSTKFTSLATYSTPSSQISNTTNGLAIKADKTAVWMGITNANNVRVGCINYSSGSTGSFRYGYSSYIGIAVTREIIQSDSLEVILFGFFSSY